MHLLMHATKQPAHPPHATQLRLQPRMRRTYVPYYPIKTVTQPPTQFQHTKTRVRFVQAARSTIEPEKAWSAILIVTCSRRVSTPLNVNVELLDPHGSHSRARVSDKMQFYLYLLQHKGLGPVFSATEYQDRAHVFIMVWHARCEGVDMCWWDCLRHLL